MEEMEEELLAKLGENRHKTGRPIRSVIMMMMMTMMKMMMVMMPTLLGMIRFT